VGLTTGNRESRVELASNCNRQSSILNPRFFGATMPTALQLFSHYPAIPPPVSVQLVVSPERACPYLPDRQLRSRALWAEAMPAGVYEQFMNAGYRRSGKILYQPICRGCRECLPIRIPVTLFRPSKTQRRCWRRNADLRVSSAPPDASDEKFELYRHYVRKWHGGETDDGREAFESFLYRSPVPSLEFCYRDVAGRLLAVGICDLCPSALSSVYFYFDPDHAARGLGTFGALFEIRHATRENLPYYYLGYWVARCGTMEYKSTFRPCEILGHDQVWRVNDPVSPPI